MPTYCSGAELNVYDSLGWSRRASDPSDLLPTTCRLKWLREAYYLPREINLNLAKLVQSGLCLKAQFASPPSESTTRRLYFGHRRTIESTARNATIACSHLGRNYQRLRTWPQLLDAALRAISREKKTLLIGTGTTLAEPTLEFASRAGIDYCLLEFPKCTFENWIRKIVSDSIDCPDQRAVSVSPQLESTDSETENPVQDAVTIDIADRVYCLSIREGGRLSSILARKIENTETSTTSSVFVCLGTREKESSDDKYHQDWLNRGAVGWWVPRDSDRAVQRCKADEQSEEFQPIQISCPYSFMARDNHENFLVHCTRAGSGQLPDESTATFQRRA